MTPEETVDEFIRRVVAKDIDGAMALCADEIEYDNVPMPTLHGKEAARAFLAPLLGEDVEVEWTVHRQVASGDTVMNERTDRFLLGGMRIAIPVAGVFQVREGLIALWRDYFDLGTFERQMSGRATA